MKELAKRDNVIGVKFSGLLTEFPKDEGDMQTVAAYFNETLEIFGPGNVMFGTDWPVCLLRTTYQEWTETIHSLTSELSEAERIAILGLNASVCYRL